MAKSKKLYNTLLILGITLVTLLFLSDQYNLEHEDYIDGPIYQIFVQSFADSNGDGVGDLQGVTNNLGYLKEFGVKGILLMPIHPALSYHKYDVTDYYGVHPDYGTIDDFLELLGEAHELGIRVYIDFVVNHTSSEHSWFKEARSSKENPYRDYYLWADYDSLAKTNNLNYEEDQTDSPRVWHQNTSSDKEWYYGFFWHGMPDLNYNNPKVREEVLKIATYWVGEVGVDGLRIDAAKYIFPEDKTDKTIAWWKEFRTAMEAINPEVYVFGEVWADAKTVAPFYGALHSAFNFDLAANIQKILLEETQNNFIGDLVQVRKDFRKVDPTFHDATFLSNHDTDRIASVLHNQPEKLRLAAALLFTLPGVPFVYYGEEIGMRGRKPDEFLREPMLWTKLHLDDQRTKWMVPNYNGGHSIVPVAEQLKAPESLLNYYRELTILRNTYQQLHYGSLEGTDIQDEQIIAFYRNFGGESYLVLHNISSSDRIISIPKQDMMFDTFIFKSNPRIEFSFDSIILPAYSSTVISY